MVIQVATAQHQPELIVALLNAYNNEAYYHMRRRQKDGSYEPVSQSGYAHIDDVITMVLKENAQSVWCDINGANVYREVLLQRLGSNAHVDNVCAMQALIRLLIKRLLSGKISLIPYITCSLSILRRNHLSKRISE